MAELRGQRGELSARVRELEAVKLNEQADVEKLEGRSLASFFYHLAGKMDERLDKERREAYAAAVKYDAAVRELEAVEGELRRCEAECRELQGCERQYETALKEKAEAVKATGGAAARELLNLEEHDLFLGSQIKELMEAISAGCAALSTTDQILSSLDSAEGWGTWDLFGGGLMADLAKHSRLDEAQNAVERLQSQLRRFKTELADVRIDADLQVNVDGFLRFADFFFDGLFADWAVMDRISRSQSQVQDTRSQISGVLSRLDAMLHTTREEQTELKSSYDALVRETRLQDRTLMEQEKRY